MTLLLYQHLFAVDDVNSFAWGLYFATLQIILYALTMPPNRNPSGGVYIVNGKKFIVR
jgi:hypothetical protein